MQIEEVKYFLNNMFSNHNEFKLVNGFKNSTDMNYMLIADAVSENIDLFASVITEELSMLTSHIAASRVASSNFSKTI
jgi:hypothetical protein